MMENFNELTPAETERLSLLLEELGEAQQAIGKILRHGYESYHPDDIDNSNHDNLCCEIGDVLFAIDLMIGNGDLREDFIANAKISKSESVKKYLHHQ